jgi:hypothetical protein
MAASTDPSCRDPVASLVTNTGPDAQANRKGDAEQYRRRKNSQKAARDRKHEILRNDSRQPRPQRESQVRHLRERTERQDRGHADRELEAREHGNPPGATIEDRRHPRVPTIAPAVLALYNRPMRSPGDCVRTEEDLMTSGSVAPISVVGTISTQMVIASRASVTSGIEVGAIPYTRT